jgi:signal transduction histidine kinase
MPAASRSGTALFQEDLLGFNRWLSVTRVQSIGALLTVAVVVKWLQPSAITLQPIVLVCAADLAPWLLYRQWLRRRRALRLMAYTQLVADMAAIVAGLFFVHLEAPLFHFAFLLIVVPASMIEAQCGVIMAALSTAGHFLLLRFHGDAAVLSIEGLLPPASFFVVASQARFYAAHLAQKNAELAAAADSLNDSNVQLEEQAAISAALLRAAQALTTVLDPHEILNRLNDVIRDALSCDFSVTLMHDAAREVYRVAAVSGTTAETTEEIRNFEFPGAGIGLFPALAQQGVLAIEDRNSPLFPGWLMERWRLGSFLCADLQRAGASVGVLCAGFSARSGAFSAREIRVFHSIAQQAAVALENARLVESLRGASRLKSEFIGTMSHELRSPLNVVIGYLDLLADGDVGPLSAEQLRTLERIREHSVQLLELIQETLDVNRLEAGLLPLDLEAFTVREFLDEVKDSIPPDWQKPTVTLNWQLDPAPIVLRTDRAKLKKILRNLVHNALKFTDRGSVTVQATADSTWIDFLVSDTGIGISPEALPVIFEMFRQVDGSSTRRHGGVGLGLYIVWQLTRALGGEVRVTSEPSVGSTFRVRFRRAEGLVTQSATAAQSAGRL